MTEVDDPPTVIARLAAFIVQVEMLIADRSFHFFQFWCASDVNHPPHDSAGQPDCAGFAEADVVPVLPRRIAQLHDRPRGGLLRDSTRGLGVEPGPNAGEASG